MSVNSVCVGKSEIQQCSLVGGLGLLIDSDILHHHVSSVVKENALDHLLSLTSVFKVWMKTVPKGSLASGIFPTQPRALEWPSTLPQALEWPSSGTERICLLQLFAENLTRSFSNRQLQNRPLLCLFLCLHFLLFIIWQRDCCSVRHRHDFFMEVLALYKLTVIIVIVEVEIVKLLTSLQDGVHVLWEGLIHAAPHLSGSYIFPVFPLSVKQFQCRSC